MGGNFPTLDKFSGRKKRGKRRKSQKEKEEENRTEERIEKREERKRKIFQEFRRSKLDSP